MDVPEWARKAVEASAGPPLRDFGGWVACLVAPAMLRWWVDRGEPPERRTSMNDFRRDVRRGPAGAADVASANGDRAYAWMFVAAGPFLLFVAVTFVPRGVPSLAGPAGVVATVLIGVTMFAVGAALASCLRWTLTIVLGGRLDDAFARVSPGKRPGGLAVWSCMPSNVDLFLALTWAACFTPALIDPAG
ncbi:hypothetical protein [Actinoplanes sp. CA-252034]|uniref:hypothetical protein n=1 Tax=Actinoplanes sp. CA-252034 TaxID=3239906 RepID=UPI003D979F70